MSTIFAVLTHLKIENLKNQNFGQLRGTYRTSDTKNAFDRRLHWLWAPNECVDAYPPCLAEASRGEWTAKIDRAYEGTKMDTDWGRGTEGGASREPSWTKIRGLSRKMSERHRTSVRLLYGVYPKISTHKISHRLLVLKNIKRRADCACPSQWPYTTNTSAMRQLWVTKSDFQHHLIFFFSP